MRQKPSAKRIVPGAWQEPGAFRRTAPVTPASSRCVAGGFQPAGTGPSWATTVFSRRRGPGWPAAEALEAPRYAPAGSRCHAGKEAAHA